MLIKQKSSSLPRNLVLGTFYELLIVFSTMVNLLHIPPLLNGPEVLSSAGDNAKLFANNFCNSNLDDSGIPSRINLKLHNISVTAKMFKMDITNLDSTKASGPNFTSVVVLIKNYEP